MDNERVPAPPRRPETTSPTHAFTQGNSGTIQTNPFNPNLPHATARFDSDNLGPSVALSSTSSELKLDLNDTSSLQPLRTNSDHLAAQPIQSSVRLPEPSAGRRDNKTNNNDNDEKFTNGHTGIDWIVPKEPAVRDDFISNLNHIELETQGGGLTLGERLQPTLDNAIVERDKYSLKAKWTGYTLNAAIGVQVLLGALTTGLSGIAVSGGRSVNTFLIPSARVSNILPCLVFHLLKTASATTALGSSLEHFNGKSLAAQ